MNIEQWEYKSITNRVYSTDTFIDWLNHWGSLGWELVSYTDIKVPGLLTYSVSRKCLFKRKKSNNNE